MPRMLDSSFARFPGVPGLVIQYIRDQELDDEEYVAGQTLIRLCMDEFCVPAEMGDKVCKKNAKDDIVASVKRMVANGVLLFKSRDGNAMFRLPVEKLADDPSNIMVEQRDRDAEDAETSLLEDSEIEDSEIRRHAAGYAEMTRGARPLIEAPAEEDISTPSRKRRRLEVAFSESSRWNSLSPAQHRGSAPRRSYRPEIPLSGYRRRSAPIQMVSPVKPRDSRDYEADQNLRQTLFKEERKDTSPPWLLSGLNELRARYPDDSFRVTNGMIDCLDCGREFKPQNHGVANFDTHLRSKSHRAIVAKKLECGSAYQEVVPPKNIDYNEMHTSYAVFPSENENSATELGRQFLTALQNEHHHDSIRTSFLERKLADNERSLVSQHEHFEKALETSRESINEAKEKFNLLSEVLKSTANKCEDQNRVALERVSRTVARSDELLKDMKQQIVKFEDLCAEKLDETNTRAAKNFQRTSDQYDKVKDHLSKSEMASRNKVEQLTDQISLLNEQIKIQEGEMTVLRLEVEEQKIEAQNMQSYSQQLGRKVEELKEANKIKDEEIQDLLSQSQLHAEELRRQRDSNLSFQKTLTDQMEAQHQQSERNMKKFVAESEERMRAMEQKLLNRIITNANESTKKTRSLEKVTAKQKVMLEDLGEHIIPSVFVEVNGNAAAIEEAMEQINKLTTVVESKLIPAPKRAAQDRSRMKSVAL